MDHKEDKAITAFSKKIKKAFPGAKVYLFGSRARGDNLVNSDYDFIIVSDYFNELPMPRRLEKVYEYWDGKYNADILPYTKKEIDIHSKLITIANKAMQEAVEI
ncbi:MAG: nucleotidyltransferase domain-containing protein [Candidatus Woesearchaeota archaeon]